MSDDEAALEPAKLFSALAPGSKLLLAVSGGPDSMALLRLAAAWRDGSRRDGSLTPPALAAATVDHGLRPESAAEAEKVAEWSRALGIPHRILLWSGEKPTTGVQERARSARYHLLCQHLREIDAEAVATAHHADDQWETVMMRLSRGSGIAGLAGMSGDQEVFGGRLVRPLLQVSKATLVDYCRRHGQAFFNDPSNEDPRFERSKWRELAAPLHRLGLTRERAARLCARAEKFDHALEWAATRFFSKVEISNEKNAYDLSAAEDTPQAIMEYFLQDALSKAAGAPPARLERLEDFARRLGLALRAGTELRATLGGCTLALNRSKRLRIALEPERKRGL